MEREPDEPSQQEKDRREALLKEYSEIGSNFRTLTDIRFRLLNLLPLAALAAAALNPAGTAPGRLSFALFGLVATLSLVSYNKRNDRPPCSGNITTNFSQSEIQHRLTKTQQLLTMVHE